jgi:hypothetical protein
MAAACDRLLALPDPDVGEIRSPGTLPAAAAADH